MTLRPRRSIDASTQRIQPCEQRLALSASLTADLLLDAIEALDLLATNSIQEQTNISAPVTEQSESPDLFAQAAQLRQSAGAGQAIDGSGQTVAVIDSGIAWDHQAFRRPQDGGSGFGPGYRIVGGWDFAEDDANPYDDGPAGFHGSHVAGLLAGQSAEFVGIAPGADLVALRVFDDAGVGELRWIESALQWVHENKDAFDSPITTVNLSVGALLNEENLADAQSILEDDLQRLREDNILVFAAAGNRFDPSASDEVVYPASSPYVQAVTSVNADSGLSEFAQRHSDIIATIGESVSSSVPDHVYGWDGTVDDVASLSGTSMATPQVAAASMLVRQSMIQEGLDPTPEEILQRMSETSQQHIDPITGETYRVIDLAAAIDRTLKTQVDSVVRFDGDSEPQHVTLDLSNGIRISVDGNEYLLDESATVPLVIDVGGGADSLKIIGSDRAERVVLDPLNDQNNRISTNTYVIELRGFEDVTFDGGGGRDRATLYDALGDDTLQSQPGSASLAGIGFRFEVNHVPNVYVHAIGGGNDTAFLRDSAGDDLLNVRPQFTSLRSDGTFQLANGFENVYAYATNGGNDTAELYDSEADDLMSISSSRSIITGANYQVSARGFDKVNAYATSGGDDIVKFYADAGQNRWNTTNDMTQWTGADEKTSRIARGFERTQIFEDFQPIELTPQSTKSSIDDWWTENATERAEREANALRQVFASLGDE